MIQHTETFFYILVRHWNTFEYFDRCVNSLLNQKYSKYKILFVDDNSNYKNSIKRYIREKLKNNICIFNTERKYGVRNTYEMIHNYTTTNDDSVVLNVDSDDWLINNTVLQELNRVYTVKNADLSYGECVFWNGKGFINKDSNHDQYSNIDYPKMIKKESLYRKYPFIPLHPRSWKTKLFKAIPKEYFINERGEWLKFCEDQIIFYALLELSGGNYFKVNKQLYVYNVFTRYRDVKIHAANLIKNEIIIRRMESFRNRQ